MLNTAPETLNSGHHIHQIGVQSPDRRNCLSSQFDLNPSTRLCRLHFDEGGIPRPAMARWKKPAKDKVRELRQNLTARVPWHLPPTRRSPQTYAGGVCQDARRTWPRANCRDRGRTANPTGNALRKSAGCSGLRLLRANDCIRARKPTARVSHKATMALLSRVSDQPAVYSALSLSSRRSGISSSPHIIYDPPRPLTYISSAEQRLAEL